MHARPLPRDEHKPPAYNLVNKKVILDIEHFSLLALLSRCACASIPSDTIFLSRYTDFHRDGLHQHAPETTRGPRLGE